MYRELTAYFGLALGTLAYVAAHLSEAVPPIEELGECVDCLNCPSSGLDC